MEIAGWSDGFEIHFRQLYRPQPFPAPDPAGTLDVRELRARDLVKALDTMGISDSWSMARVLREAVRRGRGDESLEKLGEGLRLESCKLQFRNLVIGRLAEDLFFEACLEPLQRAGYTIRDYRNVYENRDFGVVKDGLELPINVKVAGTRFDQALATVGLDPEDCIPVSSYKVVGAADPKQGKVPDLVFAHLVEHDLREKVDAYMARLNGPEQAVWQLLSWYGGSGLMHAQDQFINSLFASRGQEIMGLSAGPGNFRVISAKKVLHILDNNKARVTQIGVKSGQFAGDPTIHVSRTQETIPWQAMATLLRTQGLREVLKGIRRTHSQRSADPSL